jgi:hypothetical protein
MHHSTAGDNRMNQLENMLLSEIFCTFAEILAAPLRMAGGHYIGLFPAKAYPGFSLIAYPAEGKPAKTYE